MQLNDEWLTKYTDELEKENQELKDLLRVAHDDAVRLAKDLQKAMIV